MSDSVCVPSASYQTPMPARWANPSTLQDSAAFPAMSCSLILAAQTIPAVEKQPLIPGKAN